MFLMLSSHRRGKKELELGKEWIDWNQIFTSLSGANYEPASIDG